MDRRDERESPALCVLRIWGRAAFVSRRGLCLDRGCARDGDDGAALEGARRSRTHRRFEPVGESSTTQRNAHDAHSALSSLSGIRLSRSQFVQGAIVAPPSLPKSLVMVVRQTELGRGVPYDYRDVGVMRVADLGKQVVLDLKVQPSREPIHEAI